jgi:quercetin dioxygenase-like cupin family protein
MAYPNKKIHNPKTGQTILFIKTARETDGTLLEMISTFQPHSKEPAPHYHPVQKEEFTVLEGELTVRINRKVNVFKSGDKLIIAPEVAHSMWNNSDHPTLVKWNVRPALETEYLLETVTGMANDNQTNDQGIPGLLSGAQIMSRFSSAYRLAAVPFIIQYFIFSLLKPVALILGKKVAYHRYIN